MKDARRRQRQEQIEEAAYALLAEKGYTSTSMLSLARRAKCSNETLYNWYGDKLGLMRALVTRNAAEARKALETALEKDETALESLSVFGPMLLKLLLGERPIALNRAAAADPSRELGAALSEAGRESLFPLLLQLFERARAQGVLNFDNTTKAVELYLGLLVGDLQVRRMIGRVPPLSEDDILKRSQTALAQIQTLLP